MQKLIHICLRVKGLSSGILAILLYPARVNATDSWFNHLCYQYNKYLTMNDVKRKQINFFFLFGYTLSSFIITIKLKTTSSLIR